MLHCIDCEPAGVDVVRFVDAQLDSEAERLRRHSNRGFEYLNSTRLLTSSSPAYTAT
jgi:hypothetical protein